MHILTLCGSLRQKSSNRAVLNAFAQLAPPSLSVNHLQNLAKLPLYNPDLDTDPLPAEVTQFRDQVRQADALVVATPEYMHALPGPFKNALDWLVSDPTFPGKPIATLHVANRSEYALESLQEILRTMSANLLEDASARIPFTSNQINSQQILDTPELKALLTQSLAALQKSEN